MAHPISISDLASALVERTRAQTTKVASAPVEAPVLEHPLSTALKQAAAALRDAPAHGVSMDTVMKIAAAPGQPGTGAQSPSAGNGSGASAPGLPGLKASNLGVVAGGGGAGETQKEASSDLGRGLRKLAAQIREQGAQAARDEQTKAAHVLNAAVGLMHMRSKVAVHGAAAVTGGALGTLYGGLHGYRADKEDRLRGALYGGATGGALGTIAGPLGARVLESVSPEMLDAPTSAIYAIPGAIAAGGLADLMVSRGGSPSNVE